MNTERSAFHAILWKEFRENFKWAVLGFLFVSVGVFLTLQRILGRSSYSGDLSWADVSFGLLGATPFLTPVVGLAIGLAQVILENRGDKWGFLTHRPIPRSALFWGKAVSGILLYVAAVGLPLTCALIWMATPGHLPIPFDMRFLLPVAADVLCGLVYYFAGLLTGMREARWYASRVMGIGMGIVCSIALSLVPEFWQAVVCCALGILITGAAAWGAFVQCGRFESQSRNMRCATGVSIGAGLLITGVVVFGVAASFVPTMVSNSRETRYAFTGDGAIVQVVRDGAVDVEVQDLEGKPMDRFKDRDSRGPALTRGVVASQTISSRVRIPWNGDYRKTSEFFQPLQSSDALSNGRTFTWFYIPRLGLIAAYENRSAKLVGWLGPGGFSSGTDMPADRFEHPLGGDNRSWPSLIAFEDAVYRLDLNHRHIEKIFTVEGKESVIGASDSYPDGSGVSKFGGRFVVISTTERVVIQSRDAATQLSALRDPRAVGYGSVIVYRTLLAPEPQTFIWYSAGFNSPGFVTRYGSSNTAVAQYTFPDLFRRSTLTWGYVSLRSVMENVAMRIVVRKHSIFDIPLIQSSPDQLLVSWLIPILEGVSFAALAFARGRRYAFSAGRLSLWTAIGFALGPLGFALMLSLLEWPAIESCPACGRPRVVTRDHCEHCSKPFTLPHADGTEVFEPITSG